MGKKMAAWRIDEGTLEWLQEEAKKRSRSQTSIIEEALDLLLGEVCPTCGQTIHEGRQANGHPGIKS